MTSNHLNEKEVILHTLFVYNISKALQKSSVNLTLLNMIVGTTLQVHIWGHLLYSSTFSLILFPLYKFEIILIGVERFSVTLIYSTL